MPRRSTEVSSEALSAVDCTVWTKYNTGRSSLRTKSTDDSDGVETLVERQSEEDTSVRSQKINDKII